MPNFQLNCASFSCCPVGNFWSWHIYSHYSIPEMRCKFALPADIRPKNMLINQNNIVILIVILSLHDYNDLMIYLCRMIYVFSLLKSNQTLKISRILSSPYSYLNSTVVDNFYSFTKFSYNIKYIFTVF